MASGLFAAKSVSILPSTHTNPTGLKQIAQGISAMKPGDPKLTEALSRAVSSLDSAINPIMNALRAPLPQPETVSITDAGGSLIAWIGYATAAGKSYAGAWFKQLYVGGADASTAKLVADASGNVTITDARIVLNGSAAKIVLDPTVGDITVTDVGNTVQTVIGSLGIIISDLPSGAPATQMIAGQINITDVANVVQARINAGGFDTGAGGQYEIQGGVVIDSNKHSFFKDLTIDGTLAINNTRDANLLSVTINTSFLISSTGDALLHTVAVGTGVAINAAGVVSSTNGFTGSQTYVKTVNFGGASVTTGVVTSVAGIVISMT